MSNVRDLGQKINSLKNMQKVMRAMNMISSIKLRKIYAAQAALGEFNKSVDSILDQLISVLDSSDNSLVKGYRDVSKAHIIIFTADKGLCGTHNSSVQKALSALIKENNNKSIDSDVSCIGNKGAGYCKHKDYDIFQQSEISEKVFTMEQLHIISDKIFNRFIGNEIQKLYVIGNIFHSTLHQETATVQLFPYYTADSKKAGTEKQMFETEPRGDQLAFASGKLYLYYKLRSILRNSYLSEHSSRMTAMENASNNSEDLIEKYSTIQNHARQATITNELIEIVSGKEALKG